MPYRQEWVAPERMIRHQNVSIWCVYKDDDLGQGPRTYWFTTDISEGEDSEFAFDVRHLPEPPTGPTLSDMPPHIGHERGKELGFETYAEWQASAEYAAGKALLTEWHETGCDAAIKNTLRHAVETGLFEPNEDDEPGDDEPVMQEFSCKVGVDARVYYDITVETTSPDSALQKIKELNESGLIGSINYDGIETEVDGTNPTVIYIRDENEDDHHELVDLEPKPIATLATDDEVHAAREQYGSDEINIDEGAEASRGNDGTWVQAWVLVPVQNEEDEEDVAS
ncbi:hypothetical protein H9Q09_01020 [Aurantimonas sp. DM33-3]|uniref:hypothetical protein n=1 Tax=Aurantimonas sp. DM33-3 TaxID=2766955 RepID=UPI001651D9E0|nr:hypothetical protein [Aurantimonas sp. DM33-3]MBC6714766.1 hypothetical protein [Aurantimonas sp. DM33-3]